MITAKLVALYVALFSVVSATTTQPPGQTTTYRLSLQCVGVQKVFSTAQLIRIDVSDIDRRVAENSRNHTGDQLLYAGPNSHGLLSSTRFVNIQHVGGKDEPLFYINIRDELRNRLIYTATASMSDVARDGSFTFNFYGPQGPQYTDGYAPGCSLLATPVVDSQWIAMIEIAGHELTNLQAGRGEISDPYYAIYNHEKELVYRSEVAGNNLSPVWKPAIVPLSRLGAMANTEPVPPFTVIVYDYQPGKKFHDQIGVETEVNLEEARYVLEPIADGDIGKNIIKVQGTVFPSYDELRSKFNVDVTFAIDFSGSNAHGDLHGLYNKKSQYLPVLEQLISQTERFDSDGLCELVGFGARGKLGVLDVTPAEPFSLFRADKNPADAYRMTIEALDAREISMSGGTFFSQVIESLVQTSMNTGSTTKPDYKLIFLLTDGEINDDDLMATRKAIVQASRLPVSIILVGVGRGRMSALYRLDSDHARLGYIEDGKTYHAARDIVNFVPGNRVSTDAFDEVPVQIASYLALDDSFKMAAQKYSTDASRALPINPATVHRHNLGYTKHHSYIRMKLQGNELHDLDGWGKSDPFYVILRYEGDNNNLVPTPLYQSKVKGGDLNPMFEVAYFSTKDLYQSKRFVLVVAVFDKDRSSNQLIGALKFHLHHDDRVEVTESSKLLAPRDHASYKGKNEITLIYQGVDEEMPTEDGKPKIVPKQLSPSELDQIYKCLGAVTANN